MTQPGESVAVPKKVLHFALGWLAGGLLGTSITLTATGHRFWPLGIFVGGVYAFFQIGVWLSDA